MLNILGLVFALPYWFMLRRRAIMEEDILLKKNPGYKIYMKKVKRIF